MYFNICWLTHCQSQQLNSQNDYKRPTGVGMHIIGCINHFPPGWSCQCWSWCLAGLTIGSRGYWEIYFQEKAAANPCTTDWKRNFQQVVPHLSPKFQAGKRGSEAPCCIHSRFQAQPHHSPTTNTLQSPEEFPNQSSAQGHFNSKPDQLVPGYTVPRVPKKIKGFVNDYK